MSTTTVDGQPVHVAVAAAFLRLEAAFLSATGEGLFVSSGYRSHQEQINFFLARYAQRSSGNGLYGDVRWWQGRRYVRVSAEGTVAVPGTSLHESYRAIDIRDTGADAGVTRAGTKRSNWIKANASKHGFNPNGFGFGEPWHIEYTGALTVPAGGGGTPINGRKPINMTMVYWDGQNPTGGSARWALAGESPGTTANWIETGDREKAARWAAAAGVSIFDCGSNAEFLNYRGWYQQPVKTVGASIEVGDVKVDNTAVVAALETLIAAVKSQPKPPTAVENGTEVIRQMKLAGN